MIPLIFTVKRNNAVRQIHQVNMWLQDWCNWKKIEFIDHEMIYSTPGLLSTDVVHLSQRRNRAVAQELVGLLESFKLAWKGERDKTRLTCEE